MPRLINYLATNDSMYNYYIDLFTVHIDPYTAGENKTKTEGGTST